MSFQVLERTMTLANSLHCVKLVLDAWLAALLYISGLSQSHLHGGTVGLCLSLATLVWARAKLCLMCSYVPVGRSSCNPAFKWSPGQRFIAYKLPCLFYKHLKVT